MDGVQGGLQGGLKGGAPVISGFGLGRKPARISGGRRGRCAGERCGDDGSDPWGRPVSGTQRRGRGRASAGVGGWASAVRCGWAASGWRRGLGRAAAGCNRPSGVRRGRPGFAAAWVGCAGRADWARAREGGGRVLGQRRRWSGLGFGLGSLLILSPFYFYLQFQSNSSQSNYLNSNLNLNSTLALKQIKQCTSMKCTNMLN